MKILIPGTASYDFRYRLVMEQFLGRALTLHEIVHHKNGNTLDDRIENLEVMMDTDHTRMHQRERMNGKWSNDHEFCVRCQSVEIKHKGHGMCEMPSEMEI